MADDSEKFYPNTLCLVHISKVTGKCYFPAAKNADNYIEISIDKAYLERRLTDDHYYPDREGLSDNGLKGNLISIAIPVNDFIRMITYTNFNNGFPAKLVSFNGEFFKNDMHEFKHIKSRAEYSHEINMKRIKDLAKRLHLDMKKITSIIEKSTIQKKNKEELTKDINSLFTELHSNIPFLAEVMQEHMEDTILEAETILLEKIKSLINNAGIDALKGKKDSEILKLLK